MDTEHICPSCQKPLPPNAPKGLCPECLMKAGFDTAVAPEPGQPSRAPAFVPPAVAEVAKLFPQFEILELLGHGGMGAVYKARQPTLDRLVALKILPPQPSGDSGFADRFTREARALARLSHPNIVAVHEFGQAGGLHYFVMEYVEGLNLRQLEQAGKLSPREALKIIPQICDALQFAHDEGIVHRDIKPENVMLDKKGRVKIADFGLARILGREPEDLRLTGAKDVMGTPHYMAPEQVEHPQEVDHRADIYSLGVVFYEMLTGELPLGKFQPPSQKGAGGCAPGRSGAARAGKGAGTALPAGQRGEVRCGDDCEDLRARHRAPAATSHPPGRGLARDAAATRISGKTGHPRQRQGHHTRCRPDCGWPVKVVFGPDRPRCVPPTRTTVGWAISWVPPPPPFPSTILSSAGASGCSRRFPPCCSSTAACKCCNCEAMPGPSPPLYWESFAVVSSACPWASGRLIVLSQPEVREAFANPPPPQTRGPGNWNWVGPTVGVLALLLVLGVALFALVAGARFLFSSRSSASSSGTDAYAPLHDATETPVPVSAAVVVEAPNAGGRIVVETPDAGNRQDSSAAAGVQSIQRTVTAGSEAEFSKSFTVGHDGKLVIDVHRGGIRVAGADQDTVNVRVTRKVKRATGSDAQRILAEEKLVLKQSGDEISINAQEPPSLRSGPGWPWARPGLDVNYEITVPRKFDLRLKTAGGGIKVATVQGGVNVRTAGGSLDFDDVDGNVDGQTQGGGIRAAGCKGELVVKTAGGGITVESFAGPFVQGTTDGGSISADLAASPQSDCLLRTSGGSVTARIPAAAMVTLDAHTEGGTVKSELPVQTEGAANGSTLRGKINGGGPSLKLGTGGGSINVLKR